MMKVTTQFIVRVRKAVSELTFQEDEYLEGDYVVLLETTKPCSTEVKAYLAMELFHSEQGIECLDDFTIEIMCAVEEQEPAVPVSYSGTVEKL